MVDGDDFVPDKQTCPVGHDIEKITCLTVAVSVICPGAVLNVYECVNSLNTAPQNTIHYTTHNGEDLLINVFKPPNV